MPVGPNARRLLTVSELTALVRERLEAEFPDFWLEGELSNLRAPGSGHLYFTLKDRSAQVRAVLFRGVGQRLRFVLKEGLQVIVRGRLGVYEPRGEYQVIVEHLEPKGVGALQLAFEQLKERLAEEGLFDQARKRPLPFLPRRVGLVTSPSGAAIRDMLTVLTRRCPILGVIIAPVPVQGEGAAPQIAEAIRALGASGEVDVLIVGRGGGSLEDLWCFNEEVVVRAIAASPVPVVSAVGHEIDYTLADFAADYRAPTPSAAAEAVAPVLDDLLRQVRDLAGRAARALTNHLVLLRHRVADAERVGSALRSRVQREAQRLDDATAGLAAAVDAALRAARARLVDGQHGLEVRSPLARVRRALGVLPQLGKRAEQALLAALTLKRQAARSLAAGLDSLSPLAVLGRGYALVQRAADGRIVRDARQVSTGEALLVRLARGRLGCEVRETVPDPE
jgi:exodeoxyribonuclease VII large subunit